MPRTPLTRPIRALVLFLALVAVLVACGGQGMATAPELIDPDAITVRAFGAGECLLDLAAPAPAFLNPDPESAAAGDVPAGEVEAVQALTLRDEGGLWYQLVIDGVWVRVDTIDYTSRGDCRP